MPPSIYLPFIYIITLVGFCIIAPRLPFIPKLDPQVVARQSPIDGLRGILATAVFAFHFYINYGFGQTGRWVSPSQLFLLNMGAVPVSLFFMITGFLFFNKLKNLNTDWQSLYFGRIKRIYPLFVFLALLSVVIIGGQNHFQLDLESLIRWLMPWLWFDVQPFKPFFAKPLIVGAVWTLAYEWAFYSALPLIAMLFHKKFSLTIKQIAFIAITASLAFYLFRHTITQLYWLFAGAVVAIHFADTFRHLLQQYRQWLNVILPIAVLAIMVFTKPYSPLQMGVLAVLFGFIANGYSFFGGLYQRGLLFLGEVSYSVYLLHGVVIYGIFYGLKVFDFAQPVMMYVWLFIPTFILVVIVAYFGHQFIEMPFYKNSKKRLQSVQNPV
ncbi:MULTISPECIES: acyltransferase family protein [unclassified Moraxella]|uniref:acyltransferase family protein n=1 Tax=unclassified Moraxella TaxID=2685852 RepID=UPI003AF4D982